MESEPPKSGPERFQRWKSTLFVDPDASDAEAKIEYFRMRNSLAEKFAQVTRVSAGCDGEIMRDVIRTFQKQRFFQRGQPGQRMLLHILFGLAATRPDVGYCQGMNYVVASLLLGRIPEQYTDIDHLTPVVAAVEVEGDEAPEEVSQDVPADSEDPDGSHGTGGFEVAASVVRAVVIDNTTMSEDAMDEAEVDVYLFMMELLSPHSKLDMAGMWKEKIPKLKLRIYQLDRLLRWSYPHLHAHFTAIELSPEVITAQWFLTLFTYTFPVAPTVLLLWDYIFLTGWEGLFQVALSLLGSLQPRLLELQDFESIVMLMREWKREGTLIIAESMDALLSRASKFIINTEVLHKLQESFASEILTIALIRAQFLNNERENGSVGSASSASSVSGVSGSAASSAHGGGASGVYSAFVSLTGSGKERSVSPAPNRGSGKHFIPLALQHVSTTSTSAAPYVSTSNTGIASNTSSASNTTNNSTVNSPTMDSPASSYTGYSTESSAKASGLNSLSNTERRKEILRIQERELAIEAQIMSGAEAPVFWLLRYGSKLPEKTLQELRKIKLDLLALDDQVDVDKQQIQTKIIKACEMNRETQDELSAAELALHEASATVDQGKSSLQSALILARQVALEVVELMEGPSSGDKDEGGGGGNGEGSTKSTATAHSHNSNTSRTSNTSSNSGSVLDHGTIPAFGSYGGGTSTTNTSLFHSSSSGKSVGHGEDSGTGGSSGSGGGTGLRFPSMLSAPWSNLRKDRSNKKNTGSSGSGRNSGSNGKTNANASITTNTSNTTNSRDSADTRDSTNVRQGSSEYTDEVPNSSMRQIGSDHTHSAQIGEIHRLSGEEGSDLDDEEGEGFGDSGRAGIADSPMRYPGTSDSSTNNSSANTSTCNSPTRNAPLHTTATTSASASNSGGSGSSNAAFNVRANSPAPSSHSGGLLSSLSLSTSRLHWNFPVVRAVHHAAGIPCEHLHIGSNSREVSAKLTTKQMKQLERRGQWVQQQIIDIDRALEESKRNMEFARRRLEQAKISNDETVTWKNSLCDQLHLLVRDSNRGRSQKLMFVAENYNI